MANVVLTTIPSSSSSGLYEICQDTSNGNRIWCRIAGTDRGCISWTAGWKRAGFDYHTCKHVQRAVRTLGLTLETRGDFQYVTSGFGGTPAAPARATYPIRAQSPTAQARETRTARPAQAYVPSLEQVRKAVAKTESTDLIRRGGRRRLDDE